MQFSAEVFFLCHDIMIPKQQSGIICISVISDVTVPTRVQFRNLVLHISILMLLTNE